MGNAKCQCFVKTAYLNSARPQAFTCASLSSAVIAFASQPQGPNRNVSFWSCCYDFKRHRYGSYWSLCCCLPYSMSWGGFHAPHWVFLCRSEQHVGCLVRIRPCPRCLRLRMHPLWGPGRRWGTWAERRAALDEAPRRRPSRGIPELEQEAETRLLGKQWPGTSVMRGCTPLHLQWVWGTSQWWLSFLSPPFRGHFCPLQWAFCPLPAFCQRLTLRVCSFFCLSFLSPLENKTRLKPRLFIRLPLLLFFIMTFGSVSSCAPCSLHQCVETLFMCCVFVCPIGWEADRGWKRFLPFLIPVHIGENRASRSSALFLPPQIWFRHTSPLASAQHGCSLWQLRHHPGSICCSIAMVSSSHQRHCVTAR